MQVRSFDSSIIHSCKRYSPTATIHDYERARIAVPAITRPCLPLPTTKSHIARSLSSGRLEAVFCNLLACSSAVLED